MVMLVFACGCDRPPTVLELSIYFTCDTHGRLEPCGCFTGQLGGLTRLKTVLDGETPREALRLDVGNAAGGHADYDLIQFRYMLRAFAAMRFDALNIGHREAQFSAAQLREIKRDTPIPILSANLLSQSDRRPLFEAYRLVERGGLRIAVIGLLDPRGLEGLGAGLVVEDMETALTSCLIELKSRVDVIVLMAFADEEALVRLARQFYELDIILGGNVRQPSQDLWKENRAYIYFVTNESRALGCLRLRLAPNEPVTANHNEILLLHDHIPQDPAIRELAVAYREEVRRTTLAVDEPDYAGEDMIPGVRMTAHYTGTARCIECHKSAGVAWLESGHAHAYATLVERRAEADPKCIECHTIGFGRHSGYRREFGAEQLVDVGCESCHGPGSLHVRQQEGDKSIQFDFRPLGAGDCMICHYGEFSRPFAWEEFWPEIRHGRESQSPASISSLGMRRVRD